MILECWLYGTTRAPAWARQMGFLSESIAIWARHRRCRKAWASHLQRSRDFIAEQARACDGRRMACVIGSGWLLDVPLEELAALFEEVVLVDAVHPGRVRKTARSLGNVRCVDWDITGLCETLLQLGRGATLDTTLANLTARATPLPPLGAVDFAVSCNILSQLAAVPSRWLRKKQVPCEESQLEALGETLRSAHLAMLGQMTTHAVVVTDKTSRVLDRRGTLLEELDLLPGLTPPASARRWKWDLAPHGEISTATRTVREVAAWRLRDG